MKRSIVIVLIAFGVIAILGNYACKKTETSVKGCTDPNSLNYNKMATVDDGSCKYCLINGTPVNIGSTVGGSFNQNVATCIPSDSLSGCPNSGLSGPLSHTDYITFNNINLNFSVAKNCDGCGGYVYITNGTIVDLGAQNCLDFSYSGAVTAPTVSYTNGHGYLGKFPDGHSVKFIASNYNNGVAHLTYIFN